MELLLLPSLTLFLAFIMLFSTTHIAAQSPYTNGTNFSYPVDSPPSCGTYVAYLAQSPNFLSLVNISDLFDTSPLSIARASNVKNEDIMRTPGQLLLVPVTCGCTGNRSFANITFEIEQDDSYYFVSTTSYENLTNWRAVQDSNPNLDPYQLPVAIDVEITWFCRCPSKEDLNKGIKYLITYVWQANDNVSLVASKFNSSTVDTVNQTTLARTSLLQPTFLF